jgi:tetratricopeptide (TPR) repeat protein
VALPMAYSPWLANVAHYTRLYSRWETVQRETPSQRYQGGVMSFMAAIAAQAGKPEEARHHLTQASFAPLTSEALIVLGDWNAAEAELNAYPDPDTDGLHRLLWKTARAKLRLAQGEHAGAEALLSPACDLCHGRGAVTAELHLLPLLAEARVRRGRLNDAHPCLERAAEILAMPEDWWGLAAGVAHAEGLLAAAKRRWDDAEAAFQRAVEINEKNGLVYDKGRAFFEWAVARLDRNGPGDRGRGMELLDTALAVFEQCQASKDVEKALARKEVLKA